LKRLPENSIYKNTSMPLKKSAETFSLDKCPHQENPDDPFAIRMQGCVKIAGNPSPAGIAGKIPR
jgi:hypothetical protein